LGSNAGSAASEQDVENWVIGHGLPITTVTDAAGMELTASATIGPHHQYYVIDLLTMQIVLKGRTPPVDGIQETIDLLNQ
jgi:hypothetical protein